MAYNTNSKLRANLRAIAIAIEFQKGAALTDDSIAALKEYAGFGGLKAVLYPEGTPEDWIAKGATKDDLKLHEGMMRLHAMLKAHYSEPDYREVISSLKNSVLTAFYTPEFVPAVIYQCLSDQGIMPKRLYEPSAGSGVFIEEAIKAFSGLEEVNAVEKDKVSGLVLEAINSTLKVKYSTQIKGLEDTSHTENGTYDLVASNIPFGNFSVYDQAYRDSALSGKIHNYFFAKGLDKLADGGLMAYLTTDAFLNSPSNSTARAYLFERANFISLAVMPDNLMKETGNTEAPNHLIVVQKNLTKVALSDKEQLLVSSDKQPSELGIYYENLYISEHLDQIIVGNETGTGLNQYGQAHRRIWQHGNNSEVGHKLKEVLSADLARNLNRELFNSAQKLVPAPKNSKKLTYMPLPETKQLAASVQLGLFDAMPAESIGRSAAYLNEADYSVVQKDTARIIGTIRTADNPSHENVVVVAAKMAKSNRYLFKLCSNLKEIDGFSVNWMAGTNLSAELAEVKEKLAQYDHVFRFEGDQTLAEQFSFAKETTQTMTGLKAYHNEGMIVAYMGKVGKLKAIDKEHGQAPFEPLLDQGNRIFFERYIALRDAYIELSDKELAGRPAAAEERSGLNQMYEAFVQRYGNINAAANARRILEDGFGIAMLSSLERRDGSSFAKADILIASIVKTVERFSTEDPIEALAHSLNDKGKVNLEFISAAMAIDEAEAIHKLGSHIYLNANTKQWETSDEFLSGNVIQKLRQAKHAVDLEEGNTQYRRSLEALEKVQPERIPFELLDFNLGERWIPGAFYEKFATRLFEQETEVSYFHSLDTFKVSTGHNTKIDREFAVTPKSNRTTYGYTLLEHALENTTPFFTYEINVGGTTIRRPDNEATQLAHQKI